MRDGRRVLYLTLPLNNVDTVEVLKGPTAIQHGRVEPGGVVNLVTKRAGGAIAEAEVTFGSDREKRATFDVGGPLTASGSLAWRINAERLDTASFVDHVYMKRTFIAPTARWQPDTDTTVDLSFELRDQKSTSTPGIPVIGERPAPVPFHSYYGEPGLNDSFRAAAAMLDFEKRLSPDWSLRGGLGLWRGDYKYGGVYTIALNQTDLRTVDVGFALTSDYDKRNTDDVYLDLVGTTHWFGLRHRVVVGSDHHRQTENMTWYGNSDGSITFPSKDLYNPTYGGVDLAAFRAHAPDAYFVRRVRWSGLHLQDAVDLTPDWMLLLGARFDRTSTTDGFAETSFADARALSGDNVIRQSRFSPKAGLVWKLDADTSVYGSLARAFGLANGRSADGRTLPPETSEQVELGLKQRTLGGRLEYTVALYQLTKRNILTDDPSTADPADSTTIGQARSRGLELDVAGQLARGLKLNGSLALNRTEITRDNYGNQGHRFPNAPKVAGSLWLKWELPETFWTLGGGVSGASQVQGDNENTFQLPGYGRVDVSASYKLQAAGVKWTIQCNVDNLFDRRYYASSGGWRDMVHPAEPRRVSATLRAAF